MKWVITQVSIASSPSTKSKCATFFRGAFAVTKLQLSAYFQILIKCMLEFLVSTWFRLSSTTSSKNVTERARISYQIILMWQRNYFEAFTHMIRHNKHLYLVERKWKMWKQWKHFLPHFPVLMIFTLLPNMSASKSVTVSCVWQKNIMYNKSGLAGDWRNNLQR